MGVEIVTMKRQPKRTTGEIVDIWLTVSEFLLWKGIEKVGVQLTNSQEAERGNDRLSHFSPIFIP